MMGMAHNYDKQAFKPAWWLSNRHAQTIFSTFFRRRPNLAVRRERLELPDGDFADCDWVGGDRGPIVIVLHGLEGSIKSSYAAGVMAMIAARGWRGALLHFRGCSGEPNRLATGYHSGFTPDLDFLVDRLKTAEPDTPLAAVGFSLGANVLLKWLGERGPTAPLAGAVAVSVPFEPAVAADTVEHGLSRMYNWYLLKRMRQSTARKFAGIEAPFVLPQLARLKTFRQFDDAITAPLNGFTDAADYYRLSASRPLLRRIDVPTLILQSLDDPVVGARSIPAENELSRAVTLEVSRQGGHVGFVGGARPWRPDYWLDRKIGGYLNERFSEPLDQVGSVHRAGAATRSPASPSPPVSAASTPDSSAAKR